jgi:nucleoside-diphosphate-sugar epimerase
MGRALARGLTERGDQVVVLSPTALDGVPALWVQADAVSGRGLRSPIRQADVVVFAAAGSTAAHRSQVALEGARNASSAAAEAGARFVLLGPTGADGCVSDHAQAHVAGVSECQAASPALSVVRLPVLFGADDRWIGPWLRSARRGRRVAVAGGRRVVQPLWTGDAVAAVCRAIDGLQSAPVVQVAGPESITLDDAARAVQEQFSVGRGLPIGAPKPRADEAPLLDAQLDAVDDWDTLGLPARTTLHAFLSRVTS